MELIPGLNDDLGLECLTRIPFDSFPAVSSVCRAWNLQIQHPYFHRLRKVSGLTRPVFILAQAQQGPTGSDSTEKCQATPAYWLSVFDPESGSWTRLPYEPVFPGGLPLFCGVVGVGSDLIVMGGWDPETWGVSKAVYIFDFLTGKWRRGADMPGPARSLFGLAGDPNCRVVMVAGGHDEEKNALSSALLYDVERDVWAPLPDMAKERDECSVVFHGGTFHVIGGYETDAQGRFGRSAESLEPDTWQWGPVNESFLEATASPACWVAGDGEVYMCREGHVAALKGDTWQPIVEMPDQLRSSQKVMMWRDKMVAIGCPVYGEPYSAYVLDLKSRKWCKVEMPIDYSGNVQSCCGMEL